MIVAFLALCAYACISGIKDAILWSRKGSESFRWNEHLVFVAERVAVATLVFSDGTIYQKLMTVACWLGCFSFLHNGFYYEARNRIDMAIYHWSYESTTSTARIELSMANRTILFLVSITSFFVFS
jgi:hypothetical protein